MWQFNELHSFYKQTVDPLFLDVSLSLRYVSDAIDVENPPRPIDTTEARNEFQPTNVNLNFSMLLNGSAISIGGSAGSQRSPHHFDKFHRLKRSVSEGRDLRSVPLSEGAPTVWAMEYSDGYLVLGCSNGRIEIWDTSTGSLKV